ncbi:hypothetical protein [Lyngbya sp. PCC 8106]|uniref:hypothetical protein n=1 Tax=Lyngbya sp. (strain PCC 8106) TaxID=313612 RepID=UPI0000EA9BB6|nr:hypothetical protein [Lyngbya sp. PCC 8106]EAW37393.1 hypothetical protein L8106_12875 [Lyngbya sp. PCC 8106]
MDIVVESTEAFKQDLTAFSESEQSVILEQIQQGIPRLFEDQTFHQRRLHQFYTFNLPDHSASSLYSFIVNYRIRVVLTWDDDPIFERTLITLFRVVESQTIAEVYQQVGEQIYQPIFTSEILTLAKPVITHDS